MMSTDRLFRRPNGNRYYVVAAVPTDLVSALKKKQIWRSTRTADRVEARRRAVVLRAEIEGEFARERAARRDDRHVRKLSDDRLETIARELFDSTLADGEALRRDAVESGDVDFTAEARPTYLSAMQKDLSRGNFHHVTWWVDYVISRDGLPIPVDSEDYRYLSYLCQRAQIDAIKILIGRDNGDFTVSAADPILTRPVEPAVRVRTSELFERYAAQNPGSVKADKLNADRYAIRLFVEFVGDIDPATVTRIQVREWRDLLGRFPARAAQMDCFKGMSIAEIVAANETSRKPVIARRTVNKQLSALSVFLDWCIAEGYRDAANPCEGLTHAKENLRKVRSFSFDELVRLFEADWFKGDRDHFFWLPILSLYSGARLGELAQLNVEDVRVFHGRTCFHFTEGENGEKSLKNANSARVVPIHQTLIDIGFLDHVAEQETRVFPGATRNQRDQWASDVSRNFGRMLKALGMREDGATVKIDFHSLRHTFADGMRRAGYADNEFDILLGHKGSMTGKNGNDKAHVIDRKSQMIDALDYGTEVMAAVARLA